MPKSQRKSAANPAPRRRSAANGNILVLVTCAGRKQAARIARTLVEQRLAACASVIQAPVRSIYRWKGSIETAVEFLVILKSQAGRFSALRTAVQESHSYDVPEIISVPISAGLPAYLRWIADSIAPERSRSSRR